MFTRYKNLAFLVVLIAAQLILLAYQIRTNKEMTMVRGVAVAAMTPLAQGLEFLRSNSFGLAERYIFLTKVEEEREAMRKEVDRLKLENQFLRNELSTSDRAKALSAFQQRSRSRTTAARVIGMGAGANSKVVFIDRGAQDGLLRGMAVITPDGIVGKLTYVFPTTSQVLLVTDPTFAAGVISQKNRVPGTLKGMGRNQVKVDYVQNEVRVDEGEWFFTSGDDRVFPKGLPAGQARVIRNGSVFKEIYVDPSGLLRGLEEVLVVMEGIHESIPEGVLPQEGPLFMMTPAPGNETSQQAPTPGVYVPSTDADKARERIEKIGELQGVDFGTGGKRLPNFNMDPNQVSRPAEPLYVPPLPVAKPKPVVTPGTETAPAPRAQLPAGSAPQPTSTGTASSTGTAATGTAAPVRAPRPSLAVGDANAGRVAPVVPFAKSPVPKTALPNTAAPSGQLTPVRPAGQTNPGGQANPNRPADLPQVAPRPKRPAPDAAPKGAGFAGTPINQGANKP